MNSLAAAFRSVGTAPRPSVVTFHTAEVGDPVYDRFGNGVGIVAKVDDLAVALKINSASSLWRITLSHIGENRSALRPSKATLAAIPGLYDEMYFLNRKVR